MTMQDEAGGLSLQTANVGDSSGIWISASMDHGSPQVPALDDALAQCRSSPAAPMHADMGRLCSLNSRPLDHCGENMEPASKHLSPTFPPSIVEIVHNCWWRRR